jgi:hypothetical protein
VSAAGDASRAHLLAAAQDYAALARDLGILTSEASRIVAEALAPR